MSVETLPITEDECIRLGRALQPAPMHMRAAWQSERAVYWKTRPNAIIRDLAPKQDVLLTRYTSTRQLSNILAKLEARYGTRYTSEVQRSLIDGEIEGVLVTRVE